MKKCVIYENRICSDCGECMSCDLEPNKLCDNCGKCLALDGDREFLSMTVCADDDKDFDADQLSEEEKQIMAFLDAPIELGIPEPLEIDKVLSDKWERILAGLDEKKPSGSVRIDRAPASYAIRMRRRKK